MQLSGKSLQKQHNKSKYSYRAMVCKEEQLNISCVFNILLRHVWDVLWFNIEMVMLESNVITYLNNYKLSKILGHTL